LAKEALVLAINIHLNDLNAHLRSCVTGSGVPGAVPHLSVVDAVEQKTAPLSARGETGGTFARELVNKRFLLPVRMTEHMRTNFAALLLINATDLLATEDRMAEQLVRWTRHSSSPAIDAMMMTTPMPDDRP